MGKILVFFGVCVVVLGVFLLARVSARTSGQDSANIRKRFLGTWKLVSTEEKLKDGTARAYKDTGPNGVGYLMYSADGHMCAVLTNPDRPKWDEPPTTAQKLAAIDGLAAYCGTFKIDEANHVMLHYPALAWMPNYVGTEQRRPYRFEGNRLIFSDRAGQLDEPDVERWTITWEKAQ